MKQTLGKAGLIIYNALTQKFLELDAQEEERIRSLEIDHGSRKRSRESEAEDEKEDEADDGQEMVQEDEEDDEQEDELSMVQCEENQDEYPCSVKEGGTRGEKNIRFFFVRILGFAFVENLWVLSFSTQTPCRKTI